MIDVNTRGVIIVLCIVIVCSRVNIFGCGGIHRFLRIMPSGEASMKDLSLEEGREFHFHRENF